MVLWPMKGIYSGFGGSPGNRGGSHRLTVFKYLTTCKIRHPRDVFSKANSPKLGGHPPRK